MFRNRTSGVLLPVSALPSPYGIGDFGPEAYRFVDFLDQAHQSLWQVLPLNVTSADVGHAPYSCPSAFAGNPLLISPQGLYQAGWLDKVDIFSATPGSADHINYARCVTQKQRLLSQAFHRFKQIKVPADYVLFEHTQRHWLDDYALFAALKSKHKNKPWLRWPHPLRDRQHSILKEARANLAEDMDLIRFTQYCFWAQYRLLRTYCRAHGIQLVGDLPIYVAHDSADVWAHPQLFKLNPDKRPRFKAGVPPDYFSRTGQLWGNPVYDWTQMGREDYTWFVDRVAHNLECFDILRLDHFRGLVAYWEVPAGHKTAARGQWIEGPGAALLKTLYDRLSGARLFAEDLGHITSDVRDLMRAFALPGMAVLQFGFDGDPASNHHCVHNLSPQSIVYTGTHDNNTTRGWFEKDLNAKQRQKVSQYVGHTVTPTHVSRDMIRLALLSPARVAVIPMQDLLNLGTAARMNFPGKARGNWRWRMRHNAITVKLTDRLAEWAHMSGRD